MPELPTDKNFTTPTATPDYFINENVLPEDRVGKAEADYAEKLAQAVAVLRGMVNRIADEHDLLGLDALLSCYTTMAIEQIGFAKTIEALGNTRKRLEDAYRP